MAKVTFSSAGDTLVAYLSGEIDHHSAQYLRDEIDSLLQSRMPQTLILDFSEVSFMDSSGVGLILGRARRMPAAVGALVVQRPPAQIRKMVELARVAYV